ncbi:MAG TPA: phage tail protein, partial [Candidatus Jeotgalibaca pullicola]|nr:phage tail protein [Candidatus Jeotgalibaca pullicola]
MKLYVLTSDFETVAVMDNTLDNALHYFDDEFHRYLENGASTFDLSVVKPFKRYGNATDGTEDDYQYLVENNYLVFTYQDKDYMFNIRRVEETEISMRIYCQNLSLDLLNEYRAPYTADKQYSLAKYVNDCLYDSGYEIGINEFSSNVRTLKWEGDQTVLARILSIANSFNAEVEFETVLNADRTVDKNLVHFRKRVGVDRPDIELKYGKNVSSIRRTVDIDDLVTGLKVRGHEEDGKVTTIKNVVKSEKNADGIEEFYTRKGSEYVLAPLATQQYGRKNASGGGHIIGQYEYDTKSDTELYNRALTELKKRCVPSYEYEIEGYYDVNIGDTIRAIDEAYNPILILEARVSEQIISFSDPSKNQTKYSNYKVLENKVSQSLLDRVNQLAQMAKILQYGIDFEGSPVFKNGEGTLKLYAHVDRNNVEVTDEFTEYNWTKKNADGTVDEAWTKAHQDFGKIVAVTSDDIDGTAVFSFTVEINGEQAGNATITVSEVYDGSDGEDGVDGIQGPKGEQGIPGETGKDGKTQYTHIAYANSADGTVDFSVSNADRKYIGMYVDFTATDSTTPSDYAWTLVKGADGAQGTAGKAGADGKTPYFHTAWATSADGKTGFSTTVSAGKTYLGTYTDYTQADSTDPTK